ELARDAGRAHDGPHAVAVDGPALAGAVEVDHVKVGRAGAGPPLRHGGGVVAEDGLLRIVALPQPHAAAAAQVDGGVEQHAESPPCQRHATKRRSISSPTRWLFSGWNCVANTFSCQTADANGVG